MRSSDPARRRGRQYAAIPNAAMRDEGLSLDARGMLALLMTYSDEWVFRRSHLCKIAGIGRDKFTRVMNELSGAGYVERVTSRGDGGKLEGTEWIINDEPDHRDPENPSLGGTEALKNRPPVEPTAGKPDHIRNTKIQENQIEETPKPPEGAGDLFLAGNGESQAEPKADPIEAGFKEFWEEIWPKHKRKTGMADCLKVYTQACTGKHRKAQRVEPAALNEAARAYIRSVSDPQYLKGPLPWLRQPGWEPFLAETGEQVFSIEDLSNSQRRALEAGRVPPSMEEADGKPNAVAKFWLKRFGFVQ